MKGAHHTWGELLRRREPVPVGAPILCMTTISVVRAIGGRSDSTFTSLAFTLARSGFAEVRADSKTEMRFAKYASLLCSSCLGREGCSGYYS